MKKKKKKSKRKAVNSCGKSDERTTIFILIVSTVHQFMISANFLFTLLGERFNCGSRIRSEYDIEILALSIFADNRVLEAMNY